MAYDSFYKIDVENFKILYTNTKYWAYFYEMLYVLICFISTAPQETTEALFLECCPNSSRPGLVARAAAAQPILIKMESLKCWSMEKDIKDFIISSQNSQWGRAALHPSQGTKPLTSLSANLNNKTKAAAQP